ncbi:sensor histidine kinase [Ideonella sp. BN130291]|uniref:sensor histidine kinase n=1 Tax=Ideonella sp. BN130291 TaxID=3112940 RepID=UPI002E25762A|nr:sensor histidine kinase [Ideonella sp. BN130291]
MPADLLRRAALRFAARGSLHRQLLLWLLLPQLVLWAAAAFVTYNVAARYANRAIDASLSQATRSLARQVKPVGNGLLIDFPRAAQDIIEADPDDRVYYMVSTPPGQFILGSRKLPQPPPIDKPRLDDPYFYDGTMEGLPIRIAALYVAWGEPKEPQLMLVQIARSRASRDELARAILQDTVLPLSALIVLMTMIVWAGVRAGLAPLTRLRGLVEGRAANDLTAIELAAAPAEVRALAQAINDLLGAVQQSVAAQRRFISDAAHQLRTPLAGLKSQTELALKEASEPAQRARLERVHESATRSAHLVNQLLALARAEPESAMRQARTRVDLQRLAQEVTAELVPRALNAGVDLGYGEPDAEGPGPAVAGVELLLREALVNVIDNALRYAGRGAVVTVQVGQDARHAWLEVTDNGPGVPDALHRTVFERFFRATHEGSGCGLGLAIVKEIAERHGGSVTLANAAPHGLTVRITLPLAS